MQTLTQISTFKARKSDYSAMVELPIYAYRVLNTGDIVVISKYWVEGYHAVFDFKTGKDFFTYRNASELIELLSKPNFWHDDDLLTSVYQFRAKA